MNSVRSQSNPIQLVSTEDGIHLVGSILWLDSKHTGDLSFLSNATSTYGRLDSRIIATEETIKILETQRQKPQSLVCQYNHPFAIGRLKIELIPSGTGLGGASLWVETNKKRILYAPHIQPQKIEVNRQMQLRPADTLILGAKIPYPHDKVPSRKKEKERLVQSLAKYLQKGGELPLILCEPTMMAQEITKLLTDHELPVAVHSHIFKIHKIYESYGSSLGKYHLYSGSDAKNRERIAIFPKMLKGRFQLRKPLPDRPIITIDESPNLISFAGIFRSVVDRFTIPTHCDPRELKEQIQQVKPEEIHIFGPYAKEYVEHLKNLAPKVQALYPSHLPTLF
ncbi:MAG: hypothetical protein ACOH5I_06000 [Oligoflexus sp.]